MGTDGFYGTPLDVAATYIVLFTIYGAVLDYSGAGAVLRGPVAAPRSAARASAPGRTVTLAGLPARHGLRLGHGDHGQRRRGRLADPAPGRLPARAGPAACSPRPASARSCRRRRSARPRSSSPSTCEVSLPHRAGAGRRSRRSCTTSGILLAIEIDARRFGHAAGRARTRRRPWRLLRRFGYHFSSLFVIIVLHGAGQSPFRAVVYATSSPFAAVVPGPPSTGSTPRRLVEGARRGHARRAAGRRHLRRRRASSSPSSPDRARARRRRALIVARARAATPRRSPR